MLLDLGRIFHARCKYYELDFGRIFHARTMGGVLRNFLYNPRLLKMKNLSFLVLFLRSMGW